MLKADGGTLPINVALRYPLETIFRPVPVRSVRWLV